MPRLAPRSPPSQKQSHPHNRADDASSKIEKSQEFQHDRIYRMHNPTACWTAQQMIEAFPFDSAPNYVIRDRDGIYGSTFRNHVANMGIDQVLIAPRSPWQNPYVERVIGSIRRECLDHVIIINERHLRKNLHAYLDYYHWIPHPFVFGQGFP